MDPFSSSSWAKYAALGMFLITALKFGGLLPRRRKLPLPPGPPGLPLIGNALDVPPEESWRKFEEWSGQYGQCYSHSVLAIEACTEKPSAPPGSDVIYLNLLGQDIIVLNSLTACRELLEKRSAIYSSRPNMPMMNDFIGFDWHLGFMKYGEEWKGTPPNPASPVRQITSRHIERRKVFTQAFGTNTAEQYRPRLVQHIRNYLLLLLQDPDHFREHGRLTAGAFILDVTYGLEVRSAADPYITQAEKGMHAMAVAGTAATYAVDFIPSLKWLPSWLPGVKFKRDARTWRPHVEGMAREPFKSVEDGLVRKSPLKDGQLILRLSPTSQETGRRKVMCRNRVTART
ncbi:hypothetical protein NMY22_g16052 [Coprinellus aureogranulatus]|nr:hypothetical protein NMY22_g16052 [Coprinellus aureogranulatus]